MFSAAASLLRSGFGRNSLSSSAPISVMDLYKCSQDLTQLTRAGMCAPNLCDPVNGECDNCLADSRTCNAGFAEVCDSQGQTLTRTQCMGSTPKCNAGQCVQCIAAADCSAPSNACLQATCNTATARCGTANKAAHQSCTGGVCNGAGACVGCIDDGDCSASGKTKCLNTRCVQCRGGDCGPGYECNTSDNTCQRVSIAGTGSSCLSFAAPTSSMCGSFFCGATRAKFGAAFDPSSACGVDPTFMCEGSLDKITADCYASQAVAMDPAAATKGCIKANPNVQSRGLRDACVDCFVAATQCCQRDSSCIATCLLSPGSAQCDAARKQAGCITPLFACSGLPNPF